VLTNGGFNGIFFSTVLQSQAYDVMLDLYGPINASSITYTAKGFYVLIKMMKIVTGKLV
jgi:hypothetical protein